MSAVLHEAPMLVVDAGMHASSISRVAADRQARWAATGSADKTVRVWSVDDGTLLRTIRVPAGPGNVGKIYAVAMRPDGDLVAAAGSTGDGVSDGGQQVYLFDAATGAMARAIGGLASVVNHVVFSPDGQRLAVLLFDGGLRVYAAENDWAEVARDEAYAGQCYGAAFTPDGGLATTCTDGKLRLYGIDLAGACSPQAVAQTPGGGMPFAVAVSPDGTLAIGYMDSSNVDLFEPRTLKPLPRPALDGVDNGDLACVAWSDSGGALFAGGGFAKPADCYPVVMWVGSSAARPRGVEARHNTVKWMCALPGGDLLVASGDPWLARLQQGGPPAWQNGPKSADYRGQFGSLTVSADGTRVGFDFGASAPSPARFDLVARRLTLAPDPDDGMALPRQGNEIVGPWLDKVQSQPGFRGFSLDRNEQRRCWVVHPDGERLLFGSDWALRAFDATGASLWRRAAPGAVWAVTVSGDGRLAVAAYGDGTIRWHRMADGLELLAFMPFIDHTNWVAWTPEGFYDATAGAHGVLRWHVNQGWDAAADSVPISDIPGSFRPALPALVLQELETARALGLDQLAEHRRQILLRTNRRVPPGTRLHLLAIGISAYNAQVAGHLQLRFARRDAEDLAGAILNTQDDLYDVKPHLLADADASKLGILRELATLRRAVPGGAGQDLVVIHFSGHGALVDGKLYLLPCDVDATDDAGVKATALAVDDLKAELLRLAADARVLVLLDACHSGARTTGGAALAMDSTALRTSLAEANVTVITSCSGAESSFEDDAWQHGAFTKVLLDAFDDAAADLDRNRLVSTLGLAKYVATRVPLLTGGRQNPGMELRFDGTLFASRQKA